MLILSRKAGESLILDGGIEIKITEIYGDNGKAPVQHELGSLVQLRIHNNGAAQVYSGIRPMAAPPQPEEETPC